ncbi:prepilin signal peptidase PulO-like enzyme (type II secretory pathway) [Methanococcus maripaludis]|uniref:Prepilin signal peptidase PulO-like enzyme (Type II secretory pathway) n=2 Tax=Methanococcus maripaludis TaxID=39152 RepID=A0A7J9PNQ0_METMI|nr:prepilin signal peptidase PulO-like enzyme (type II secretory pathway) [Methanococcus maripaludis]
MLFHLSKIDIKEMLLPDKLTLPLLVINVILVGVSIGYLNALVAASIGLILGLTLQYCGKSKLGGGDVKLFAALAPTFLTHSYPYFFYLAGLSFMLSAVYAAINKKFKRDSLIPMGPFIAVSWAVVVGVGILTGIYV